MSFAANANAQRRKQCAVFHSKKSGFVPSAASVTLTSVRDVNNGWVTLAAMTIRHEEEAQDEVARRLVAYAERLRREANRVQPFRRSHFRTEAAGIEAASAAVRR